MTVKTDVSRFHIHDELTAPEGSSAIIKGISSTAGQAPKYLGVLAGSPAALRAFARMRHELRGGVLPETTRIRIALAVAELKGDHYSLAQHSALARRNGLGLDEISRARSFDSGDERELALLKLMQATVEGDAPPPHFLHEEAREIGWSEEEILEAIAHLALNEFQCLVASAAALPLDQGNAAGSRLAAAA